MNKSELKQYIIENALKERRILKQDQNLQEYFKNQGDKKGEKLFKQCAERDLTRWAVFRELIEVMDIDEDYMKALIEENNENA